jgi:hypothetical protein
MSSQTEYPGPGADAADEAGAQGSGAAPGAGANAAAPADQPGEEQLRAAYEAELSRIASVDMVLQAAASLLNIGAHRLGLTGAPGQATSTPADLEQVRDAIDAVRGLLPVIERSAPAELRPLRDALSQLQMAYSRAVQSTPGAQAKPEEQGPSASAPASPAPGPGTSTPGTAAPSPAGAPGEKPGPGPAESSGRLWVPGR